MMDDTKELKIKAMELEATAGKRVSEISAAVDQAVASLSSSILGDDPQLRSMLAMVIGTRLVGAGALILDELHPDAGHDMAHGIVCETIKAGGLGHFVVCVQVPGESAADTVARHAGDGSITGGFSGKPH